MKKILVQSGTVLVALLLLAVTVVTIRIGLAALQARRAPETVSTATLPALGSTNSLTIMPLYEEAASSPTYLSGHGVSHFVHTDNANLLMDLGNNPEQAPKAPVLLNMQSAGIAPGETDILVISHNHPDHLGG